MDENVRKLRSVDPGREIEKMESDSEDVVLCGLKLQPWGSLVIRVSLCRFIHLAF